tara:strand:- start:3113 stop:3796 length:684 start_codon:yes stop_codon:yes gene_type:complete
MIRKVIYLCMAFIMLGCQSQKSLQMKKVDAFGLMYQEKPLSIVVVPVINKTTAADAGDIYQATIARPLAEMGYYVLSIPFTQQLLKREGVSDGELAQLVTPSRYHEVFGADAVLFVQIKQWDTNYVVIAGSVVVAADLELKSTKTGKSLWRYSGQVVHQTSKDTGAGPIANMIATAINTAATEYYEVAKSVNYLILKDIPRGLHHKLYLKDQDFASGVIINQPETSS